MEKDKINTERFFTDRDFKNLVELTQEEAEILQEFEVSILYHDGLSGLSGGFANVILEDFNEEDNNIIWGNITSGIQNECEDRTVKESIFFNRTTKKIEFN